MNLGLLPHIIEARCLEFLVDPVNGVIVGDAAEDAVALGVGVSHILEFLGTGEKGVELDVIGEFVLFML